MKVRYATFVVEEQDRQFSVTWDDYQIVVSLVSEVQPETLLTVKRVKHGYKPCATHAMELVAQARGKKPVRPHGHGRFVRRVPSLGLVK